MKKIISSRIGKSIYGGLCGLINGFFGSGGGIIAVQLMEKGGIEHKKAHASSLIIIFPLCAVSAAVYFFTGSAVFDENTIWLLGGAALGGILGAFLLGKLKSKIIDNIFTLLILASGIRMVF